MRLSTEQIKVPDGQNRDNSDKTIIQSVEKEGILVPLLVYEENGVYYLVAGHRRLASAIHFKLPEVPVQVIPKDQAESARALENLDRKGLHPLDEAAEIRTLQAKGYENNVIAAMLGMELPKVIRRAKLNNLTDSVRASFMKGEIDAAAAEEFAVMEQEDQNAVYKNLGWRKEARDVRKLYMDSRGISLGRCSKDLLEMGTPCATCPKNLASDNILFDGESGSCRDTGCYCGKIRALMQKHGLEEVYIRSYDEKSLRKTLERNKLKVTEKDSWKVSDRKTDTRTVKVMDAWGNVGYEEAPPEKVKVDPAVRKRRAEIKKRYKELYAQLTESLEKMVFEHADAYMSKFHKDERFPDKDERVILAKHILNQGQWRLNGFISGKLDYDKKPLDGADNKRILSVILLYCATAGGETQQAFPDKVEKGGTLLLPKSIEIEDLYQLRTSKARKKVMEIKSEMEDLLKEFSDLEGK